MIAVQKSKFYSKIRNERIMADLKNPSSAHVEQRFADLRAAAKTRLREIKDRWWQELAAETKDMLT